MEVFHCEAMAEKAISLYNGPCFAASRPKDTEVCKKVMAAWAMGATPFKYPKVKINIILVLLRIFYTFLSNSHVIYTNVYKLITYTGDSP